MKHGYAFVVAVLMAALTAGCEISGEYHGDNVDVQFGNTNATTQTQAQ